MLSSQTPLPSAFYLVDHGRARDPLAPIADLPPGVGVIVRDYGHPDRAAIAARAAGLCRAGRRVCLIAGDPRLAVAVRADGVHWPEGLSVRIRRRRPWALESAAAHSVRAANAALARGADAVLLSPVFATRSHPDAAPLGPHRAARLCRAIQGPVYALGGVDCRTRRRLPPGFAGFAAIDGFALPP